MNSRSAAWSASLESLSENGCTSVDAVHQQTGVDKDEIQSVLRNMEQAGWAYETENGEYRAGVELLDTLSVPVSIAQASD